MVESTKYDQCQMCFKMFTSLQTLKVHQENIHKENRERSFPCRVCEKSFYSNDVLVQHEKCHQSEYECNLCKTSYKDYIYYKNHLNIVHGKKRFKCKLCLKAFSRKLECENHERTHTGERPFCCTECPKTFTQRSNLVSHIRITHKGEKKYECPECPNRYNRRRLLNNHLNSKHKSEEPIKCTWCNEEFVYLHLITEHSRRCSFRPTDEFHIMTLSTGQKVIRQCVHSQLYFYYRICDPNEELDPTNTFSIEQEIVPSMRPGEPVVRYKIPRECQEMAKKIDVSSILRDKQKTKVAR